MHVKSHALMAENGFLAEVELPHTARTSGSQPLVRLSATPGVARAACTVGQHTKAILRELGFADPDITDLATRAVARLAEG